MNAWVRNKRKSLPGDRQRLVDIYTSSTQALVSSMLPVTAGFFLLAPDLLDLWLGEDFRISSTPVMQWLAVGWMVNVFALQPLTALQSTGRPDDRDRKSVV